MRVSHEVRIYPLTALSGEISSYLELTLSYLKEKKVCYELKKSNYLFQKKAGDVLMIFCA
jgi:uncharacterized protein YqgV (UPF0045/DUF77 family)